jgi:oligoendopeptidase F
MADFRIDIEKIIKNRIFVPVDFEVGIEQLDNLYEILLKHEVTSVDELIKLLSWHSELMAVFSENFSWRHINITIDTSNENYTEQYNYYLSEILPFVEKKNHLFESKLINSPFLDELVKYDGYQLLIKNTKSKFGLYKEENLDLLSNLEIEANKYSSIVGAMTVDVEGKELTLQQAGVMLESHDRNLREKVYKKIEDRRALDKDKIDDLYTYLIKKRTIVAKNAGFENFRDYRFVELCRWDYTAKDCYDFHDAIAVELLPILIDVQNDRKRIMQIDNLRPWDTIVDVRGNEPLRPFVNEADFMEKSIKVLDKIDPFFGNCLKTMLSMKRLDIFSRKNKAPGGYNCPLDETVAPYIFMNATSTLDDVITFFHESGHAVHSFLMKNLKISAFKHPSSEVAELASMTMEFFSMSYWDVFFNKEEDLRRAKKNFLEKVLRVLPWVAIIDKFQHWVYENPEHSIKERTSAWNNIFDSLSDTMIINWDGLNMYKDILWQKQLHLFTDPFYYVEYGIAQLGAIALWKQYIEDPKLALDNYIRALSIGYTKSVPEIYAEAGIPFKFDAQYVKTLALFIKDMWAKL